MSGAFSATQKIFLLFIFVATSFAYFASAEDSVEIPDPPVPYAYYPSEPPPEHINSVNFYSGVPRTGGEDKTGGWGDVAANVTEALNLADSRPELQINFIVISRPPLRSSQDATSETIVTKMVPGLDSTVKDKVQKFHNINFIFPSNQGLHDIERNVPRADIGIVYSNGGDLMQLVKHSSRYAFVVDEFNGHSNFVIKASYSRVSALGLNSIGFLLNSGAKSLGFYLSPKRESPLSHIADPLTRRLQVLSSLSSLGLTVPEINKDTVFAFSYTKNLKPTLNYIRAVVEISRNEKFSGRQIVIFAKKNPAIDLMELPTNIKVVQFSEIPARTLEQMIWESDIHPLVTGDSSLSIAIAAATREKGFLYEMNRWKIGSALALVKRVREYSATSPIPILDPVKQALTIPPDGSIAEPAKLAELLENKELWRQLHIAIEANYDKWRLTNNLLDAYQILRAFHDELSNFALRSMDINFLFRLAINPEFHHNRDNVLEKIINDHKEEIGVRALAVYCLIKYGNLKLPSNQRSIEHFFSDVRSERPQRRYLARKKIMVLLRLGIHHEPIRAQLSAISQFLVGEARTEFEMTLERFAKWLLEEDKYLVAPLLSSLRANGLKALLSHCEELNNID